jgi:micrococcal nuclease
MKGEPQNRRLWFWWLVFITLLVLVVVVLLKVKDIEIKLPTRQPGLYSVTEFIDGDTIAVNMNGTTEIIRMIGIDTPETHRPNTPVQCYGPQAAAYTKSLIGNNKVRLQADPLNTNRDRYERLLRYVYLPDGTLLESKIISEGYGFAYTQFPYLKTVEFEKLEDQAERVKKGLWGACQVTVSANGLEQTNIAQ